MAAGWSVTSLARAAGRAVDNIVHPRQKTYFVTKNKNHVFGTDFAARESMTTDDATARFDEM